MTNEDRTLIEGVEVEALDGDSVILSVRSFTDKTKRYMVTADFQSGTVRCDCPDAMYRSKIGDFTDETGFMCKHMRRASKYLAILSSALRLFKESK